MRLRRSLRSGNDLTAPSLASYYMQEFAGVHICAPETAQRFFDLGGVE